MLCACNPTILEAKARRSSKFMASLGSIVRLSQRKKGKELQSPVEAQVGNKSLSWARHSLYIRSSLWRQGFEEMISP